MRTFLPSFLSLASFSPPFILLFDDCLWPTLLLQQSPVALVQPAIRHQSLWHRRHTFFFAIVGLNVIVRILPTVPSDLV